MKSKEFKVGLLMIVGLVTAYFGINYLKGSKLFNPGIKYTAVYEKVDGLSVDNHVMFNGVAIGKVREISLENDGSGLIRVTFEVTNENVKVTKGSMAEIASTDIFGTRVIALIPNKETVELAVEGEELNSSIHGDLTEVVDERLRPLEAKISKLLASVEKTSEVAQDILNDDVKNKLGNGIDAFGEAANSINSVGQNLNYLVTKESENIQQIIEDLAVLTNVIKENEQNIDATLGNLKSMSDSLALVNFKKTFDEAEVAMSSIAEVMQKINNGEGTAGKLINNDSVYMNLERASKNLEILLEDIEQNPNRYVHFSIFGRKNNTEEESK